MCPTTEPPATNKPGQCPPEDSYSPCKCRGDAFDDTTLLLDCDDQFLDDQRVSEILNVFLNDPDANPLRALRLEFNLLTRIPDEIKLFPNLEEVYLFSNDIETIAAGSMSFTALEKIIGVGYKVKTIEPGAFVGII